MGQQAARPPHHDGNHAGTEGQRMISETGLAIPSMISVAQSKSFTDPLVKPFNDRVYLDAVAGARPIAWPPDPRYMHQFRIRMEEAFKIGSKTIPEALAAIQSDWESFRRDDLLSKDYSRMPWSFVALAVLVPLALGLMVAFTLWWQQRHQLVVLRVVPRRRSHAPVLHTLHHLVKESALLLLPFLLLSSHRRPLRLLAVDASFVESSDATSFVLEDGILVQVP